MARTYTFTTRNFIADPGAPTVDNFFLQAGSITTIPGADLSDGETFTLDDGTNTPVVFELDSNASVGGGHEAVVFTALDTATEVRDAIIAAINGASSLDIAASIGGAAIVTLTGTVSTDQETTNSDTVTDPDFVITGMDNPGATTWAYKVVAEAADGTLTAASSAGSTTTGPAVLSEDDYNHITWTDPPETAAYVRVYRTTAGTTPAVVGLIARVAYGVEEYDDIGDDETYGAGDDTESPPTTSAAGVSDSVCVYDMRDVWLQFSGTFVSDNQVQGSIDGANWENLGDEVTETGLFEVVETVAHIRIKQTGYTSGDPVVCLMGREE